MDEINLSVVIPHYGDPAPTLALVATLVPQVEALAGEIIVVDDCSLVPLIEIPGAEVIRRAENGGFGAAVNTGVARARGSLVAILNSDLIVGEDFIRSYVDAARPWLPAVVAPRVATRGHEGASTFRFPSWRHVLAQRTSVIGNRRQRRWASDLIGEDRPRAPADTYLADWVSGAAMLMPADCLRAVGGFDERFHMYLEETDLQFRLSQRGIPAVYVGNVVADHIGFASSDPARRERWQVESWLVYAEKWRWKRRLWIALEGASAINLLTETLRGVLGRETAPLRDWRRRRALTRSVWADRARMRL